MRFASEWLVGIKNHDKVFSLVRLVVTTQKYGDFVTETKHHAFGSRGKQYPKCSAQIVVSCTFILLYLMRIDVHGTIGSEVNDTTSRSGLYCAYIHSDYRISFHTYMHICMLCALHVHAHEVHTPPLLECIFSRAHY